MATRTQSIPFEAPTGSVPSGAAVAVPMMRSVPASLVMLGVVIVLVAAWGGIVAYVGPTFGFSADGAAAWQWTFSHTVLALVPGAVAFVSGLLLISIAPRTIDGRGRADLALLGTLTVLSGAWFAVGPLVWPVIRTARPYFVAAPPFQLLTHELGYSVGPGIVLVVCGGFAIGWAVRHQRPIVPVYSAFVAVPAPEPAFPLDPPTVPAEAPPTGTAIVDATLAGGVPLESGPSDAPYTASVATDPPPNDMAATEHVPAERPVPPEPTERAQRSGRPVPSEPPSLASWPMVPPPGPSTPPSQPPMGWRSPDVTGPVDDS